MKSIMFITFNTIKQAENYIKRHSSYSFTDGCGCCGYELSYSIKDNKIIYFSLNTYAGNNSVTCKVIGKIKQKVGVTSWKYSNRVFTLKVQKWLICQVELIQLTAN